MKFVILTDTHLVSAGRRLYALDPAERLARAIDVINRDHADIAFILICGDLVHHGDVAAYELLGETLGPARVPVKLMMGNHDRRGSLRTVFDRAHDDGNGFVQWAETFPACSIIALDTLDEEGQGDAGLLCEARLDFLRGALLAAPTDRPLLLFQHHPPFDVGLPSLDEIKLKNGAAEWAVMTQTRVPDYLFIGHVHRPINGLWQGIPFHIQRALAHQVDFDFQAEAIPGTHELPDYSLVMVDDGQITIHTRSFLYEGPRYSLLDPEAAAATSADELKR